MQKRTPGRLSRRGGTTRCGVGIGYSPRFGRPPKYPALVWWYQVLVQLHADDAIFHGARIVPSCKGCTHIYTPPVLRRKVGGENDIGRGLGSIRTAQYEFGFTFLPGTETLYS